MAVAPTSASATVAIRPPWWRRAWSVAWTWFKGNWIHVIETIGVGVAAYGLLHTAEQLTLTNRQIGLTNQQLEQAKSQLEQAKLSLRANTIFNIQRDGRDLIGSIAAEPNLFRFIYDLDNGASADADTRLKAEVKVGQLINFYSSMYNQFQAGAVDEKFWRTGLADMCFLLNKTYARSMWRGIIKSRPDRYQSGFLEEGQTCFPKEN
jgi:hypothetical protein